MLSSADMDSIVTATAAVTPARLLSGCSVGLEMLSTHRWAHCAVNETSDLTKALPGDRLRPPLHANAAHDEADDSSSSLKPKSFCAFIIRLDL